MQEDFGGGGEIAFERQARGVRIRLPRHVVVALDRAMVAPQGEPSVACLVVEGQRRALCAGDPAVACRSRQAGAPPYGVSASAPGGVIAVQSQRKTEGEETAAGSPAAPETRSPMNLAVAVPQMRRDGPLSTADSMPMGCCILSRMLGGHVLHEVSRAVHVDDGDTPHGPPARPAARNPGEVHFAPMRTEDLVFS